jgi:hypothetical protein
MTLQEILIAARAKIADPAHWCQRSLAVDSRRIPIGVKHSDACAWGALGALGALEATSEYISYARALLYDAAYATHGMLSIVIVNDELGHAAVLQMYDYAIKLAGETP